MGDRMGKRNEILIVDDSRLNRRSLADVLDKEYQIVEAKNGKEALEILAVKWSSVAIIILDLVMPVMDGFAFLDCFRKVKEYRHIPVIVATANDDVESEKHCLELGVWDFIPKTFHPDIIRFRVMNAINRSKDRDLEYDTLTGIYNQQRFYQATREMLDNHGEKTYVFIHFDIDRFKMINSFYGVKEGDKLICYVADTIKEVLKGKKECTYGRINGDIFGICMAFEKISEVEAVTNGIIKQIKKYSLHHYLETSAGIYVVEDNDMEISVLYDKASIAARQCKGQYMVHEAFYTKEMGEKLIREQKIINEMDLALQEDQFLVYFQPKYELDQYQPYGAEALVRWKKPDGRLVTPGEFIPIFEKNGFITKLDYYVWEKVCQFIRKELEDGKIPDPISVNVSRVNMYNPKLLESLINLVEKYKVPPKYLNLELTESVFSDNAAVIQRAVDYLHKAGFTIMMDDFGSGYSSLNVLKDVNLDVLKIDMKFLSKGEPDSRGEKILEAVIKMADSLKMPVIAEGVEEKQQVELLSRLGCNYIQGFYFARPMPLADYRKLIEKEIK